MKFTIYVLFVCILNLVNNRLLKASFQDCRKSCVPYKNGIVNDLGCQASNRQNICENFQQSENTCIKNSNCDWKTNNYPKCNTKCSRICIVDDLDPKQCKTA